jgi:hypothetical protein
MEFLSRVLRPRGRRHSRPAAASRVTRRGGTTKKSTKRVRGGTGYLRTALDRMARSLTRGNRRVDGKKLVAVYHHGTCTVDHRSKKAAARCRRTH